MRGGGTEAFDLSAWDCAPCLEQETPGTMIEMTAATHAKRRCHSDAVIENMFGNPWNRARYDVELNIFSPFAFSDAIKR
jgi:hypothetical protein